MAAKGTILQGVVDRMMNLRRIIPDSAGRVRVAVESSTNTQAVSGTVAVSTVTTVTNWGVHSGQSFSQQQSNSVFQSNFRKNLLQS